MKVLIVGSGGREHAIAYSVSKSKRADKIYCAPGNGGIAGIAECVNISAMEFDKLADFAQDNGIDLTIIGMDDPAATGKILSYYGILYPFIGGHVNIVPDFDRKRIEGSVLIKGKVRLFTFIKAALRIYFSKDIRKLLSLFKKEDI